MTSNETVKLAQEIYVQVMAIRGAKSSAKLIRGTKDTAAACIHCAADFQEVLERGHQCNL